MEKQNSQIKSLKEERKRLVDNIISTMQNDLDFATNELNIMDIVTDVLLDFLGNQRRTSMKRLRELNEKAKQSKFYIEN